MDSLKQQITAPVAVGLAVLFLITCITIFDNFSRWNADLVKTVSDQKLQISQMRMMSEAPQELADNDEMLETLALLRSRLLQESTTGLNSASFQQEIRQTLQECGLQNTTVLMSITEAPEDEDTTIYESSVRAQDFQSRLAVCLDKVSNMSVAAKVSYIRWSSNGSLQLNILGFSTE